MSTPYVFVSEAKWIETNLVIFVFNIGHFYNASLTFYLYDIDEPLTGIAH